MESNPRNRHTKACNFFNFLSLLNKFLEFIGGKIYTAKFYDENLRNLSAMSVL